MGSGGMLAYNRVVWSELQPYYLRTKEMLLQLPQGHMYTARQHSLLPSTTAIERVWLTYRGLHQGERGRGIDRREEIRRRPYDVASNSLLGTSDQHEVVLRLNTLCKSKKATIDHIHAGLPVAAWPHGVWKVMGMLPGALLQPNTQTIATTLERCMQHNNLPQAWAVVAHYYSTFPIDSDYTYYTPLFTHYPQLSAKLLYQVQQKGLSTTKAFIIAMLQAGLSVKGSEIQLLSMIKIHQHIDAVTSELNIINEKVKWHTETLLVHQATSLEAIGLKHTLQQARQSRTPLCPRVLLEASRAYGKVGYLSDMLLLADSFTKSHPSWAAPAANICLATLAQKRKVEGAVLQLEGMVAKGHRVTSWAQQQLTDMLDTNHHAVSAMRTNKSTDTLPETTNQTETMDRIMSAIGQEGQVLDSRLGLGALEVYSKYGLVQKVSCTLGLMEQCQAVGNDQPYALAMTAYTKATGDNERGLRGLFARMYQQGIQATTSTYFKAMQCCLANGSAEILSLLGSVFTRLDVPLPPSNQDKDMSAYLSQSTGNSVTSRDCNLILLTQGIQRVVQRGGSLEDISFFIETATMIGLVTVPPTRDWSWIVNTMAEQANNTTLIILMKQLAISKERGLVTIGQAILQQDSPVVICHVINTALATKGLPVFGKDEPSWEARVWGKMAWSYGMTGDLQGLRGCIEGMLGQGYLPPLWVLGLLRQDRARPQGLSNWKTLDRPMMANQDQMSQSIVRQTNHMLTREGFTCHAKCLLALDSWKGCFLQGLVGILAGHMDEGRKDEAGDIWRQIKKGGIGRATAPDLKIIGQWLIQYNDIKEMAQFLNKACTLMKDQSAALFSDWVRDESVMGCRERVTFVFKGAVEAKVIEAVLGVQRESFSSRKHTWECIVQALYHLDEASLLANAVQYMGKGGYPVPGYACKRLLLQAQNQGDIHQVASLITLVTTSGGKVPLWTYHSLLQACASSSQGSDLAVSVITGLSTNDQRAWSLALQAVLHHGKPAQLASLGHTMTSLGVTLVSTHLSLITTLLANKITQSSVQGVQVSQWLKGCRGCGVTLSWAALQLATTSACRRRDIECMLAFTQEIAVQLGPRLEPYQQTTLDMLYSDFLDQVCAEGLQGVVECYHNAETLAPLCCYTDTWKVMCGKCDQDGQGDHQKYVESMIAVLAKWELAFKKYQGVGKNTRGLLLQLHIALIRTCQHGRVPVGTAELVVQSATRLGLGLDRLDGVGGKGRGRGREV